METRVGAPEQIEQGAPTEASKVSAWRFDEFSRMGIPGEVARALADSRVDLRQLERMLEEGCELALAVRILA